jgi:hypothetical protein
MIDPHQIAMRILGNIDWQTEVSGLCRCPGEPLHTKPTGPKDCRVNLDGAPTIFCFHSSCIAAVAEANRRLRSELGANPWAILLPGGRVLRNGDVLQRTGEILPREVVTRGYHIRSREAQEKTILATIRVNAERFIPEMLDVFYWPYEKIIEDSPLQVCERDPEDQFRTWLRLWPAHCIVWIGEVYSSGSPVNRTNFRPLSEWSQIGAPAMGNYTCGSAFKPGSFSRSNENLLGHRFLVVESDTLSKDEVGAIFAYMQRRLHYRLHCIIDTAGKSLHGWFDAPRNAVLENRLN